MGWSSERIVVVVCLSGALATTLSGCGSNLYRTAVVTGTVLCDGKPAEGGTVVLMPIDDPGKTGRPKGFAGRPSTGQVGADGKFRLTLAAAGTEKSQDGAVTGMHAVTFRKPRTEKPQVEKADLILPAAELDKLKADLESQPIYKPLSCGATILPNSVEVKSSGKNEFAFTLQPESEEERTIASERKERASNRRKKVTEIPPNGESPKE